MKIIYYLIKKNQSKALHAADIIDNTHVHVFSENLTIPINQKGPISILFCQSQFCQA